ncbi:hypothetical protein Sxan_76290 [Streptomyces xanthophaeus]|uniref:Uncharacterized protein n=1 Tax=Streptomyces xanthophaeus TaxID=67385 RepID=A0A919H4I9_9ACTN|nr:hypothetical protein Sxan_76290 [Streptomyces xanthophaeus]
MITCRYDEDALPALFRRPPVFDVAHVIEDARARGWDVCLGLTPSAAHWLAGSLDGLAALTGHPVRVQYKLPGSPTYGPWPMHCSSPRHLQHPQLLGARPHRPVRGRGRRRGARQGHSGGDRPLPELRARRAPRLDQSLAVLSGAGATVLYGEGGFVPGPAGPDAPDHFPWQAALDAVDRGRTAFA